MTMIGLAIFALGDTGAPVFGMYIWVVIGNGFRFGLRYLYGATALALLSFYCVAYFSPYYRSNVGLLVLGTFLLAVVIPIYLGGLLKQLQHNLEAAREADRLKTRFLANVSHDLRTPLNVIMANCDLLGREMDAGSQQLHKIKDMREASTTLNGLVIDLLDIAKLEAGRISITPAWFNIAKLLGRIARFNQVAARDNGTHVNLTIKHDLPVRVFGDALRLEQVLNNIVSNAVKFTADGTVNIEAAADIVPQTGFFRGIRISVKDTGIGMAPDAIERIFSRFEQADISYTRQYSGAGLGLSIANELINLMGGAIVVESTQGEGSRFSVSIPCETDSQSDYAKILRSFQFPVIVVCGKQEQQQYWQSIFNGTELPNAAAYTLDKFARDGRGPAFARCDSLCLLVDGRDLDDNEIQSIVASPDLPQNIFWIMVTAPTEQNKFARRLPQQGYQYQMDNTCPDELGKALAAAYWTGHSEELESNSEDDPDWWSRTLKGLTVLVADDSELNRRVIANILGYINARVLEAGNGAEALGKLLDESVDIALLDIQMPEFSGIEVMRAYAEREPGNPAVIVALTADTTEECRSECLGAGAASILYKPIVAKSLLRELHGILFESNKESADTSYAKCAAAAKPQLVDYTLLHELHVSSQGPHYIRNLVSCFKNEGIHLLEQLRQSSRANDTVTSRGLFHRLQGMSCSIGANAVARLCHDILTLSDTHLLSEAEEFLDTLFQLHDETANLLDNYSINAASCFQDSLSTHYGPGPALRFPGASQRDC
jgi:two-component system sensor histidine kinase RpfC